MPCRVGLIASFKSYTEPLLNFCEVDVTKKAGSEGGDPYIVLREMEGLVFKEDYSEEKVEG